MTKTTTVCDCCGAPKAERGVFGQPLRNVEFKDQQGRITRVDFSIVPEEGNGNQIDACDICVLAAIRKTILREEE